MFTTSPPPETQVYDPALLTTELEAVQTEGKILEDVVEEVVRTCAFEGVVLSTAKSTRCRDGGTDRVDMKKLICTRGGGSRQLEHEARLDTEPGVIRRNRKGSARTGCQFEVSVRHANSHPRPKITNIKLGHNHVVDRQAMAVKLRLAGKLTEEQRGQVEKMTSKGMKPKAVHEAIQALHEDSDIEINRRAVQNVAASVHGAEKPRDAADAYEEVMAVTADGGVCEIKMDDSGRLTHIWWQTREQMALWNRYRMPLGVLAVIDSEYRTRIVGQSITADTTTNTFVWMLKSALRSRGGKQPDIFIQDADVAMTAAVREVFPDALARRCLWHLYQHIMKALAKDLGGQMKAGSSCAEALTQATPTSPASFRGRSACSCFAQAFMDEFRCVRQQLSLAKFERKFNALIAKYPQTEKYMRAVYDDRTRWAEYVSPLVFSVGSWTTPRVEVQLLFRESSAPRRMHPRGVTLSTTCRLLEWLLQPTTAFKSVLESCEFSIAAWPRRLMEQEMTAAILYCQIDGG
ncbi:unnamed protein product [Ectocarpus sp. CCAP 1310/34]|nr:unnamed protein product [Ectocarpus sp. CCAP 1310/34]